MTNSTSPFHFVCSAIGGSLLCSLSLGQELPITIDLKHHDLVNLSNKVAKDVSVVNLDHLELQELLFQEIKSVSSLHLAASKPTKLSEAFLPVLQNLTSLSLENLILSKSLFTKCFNTELSHLQLTGIQIPSDLHRIEIGTIDSLSIVGCDFRLILRVRTDQTVDKLAFSYPTDLELEISDGATVRELSLLARGFHVEGELPLKAECSVLRLHGFNLSALDFSGLRTNRIVIEESILDNQLELRGFSASQAIDVSFKNCRFIRR